MKLRLAFSLLLAVIAAAALAATASARLIGFQTPSGNIGCYMDRQSVRCDIRKKEWEAPPPPADCMFDYGYGVFLDRTDPARFVCASDTTLDPAHPVLRNGEKEKTGRFKCKNREGAIKCVNKVSEHGFEISKQSVDLF